MPDDFNNWNDYKPPSNVIVGKYDPKKFNKKKKVTDSTKMNLKIKHTFMEFREMGRESIVNVNVIQDSLEVIPDLNISITNLNTNKSNFMYKHFFNSGYGGITFKCSIIIDKDKKFMGQKFTKVLDKWCKKSTVIIVTTKAIDIPNGSYIITKNASRKQGVSHYTTWDLEFTQYRALSTQVYENNSDEINDYLRQLKAKKNKKKNKNALNKKLKKCKLSQFKYYKKKKNVNDCVKTLQKLLKKNGYYIHVGKSKLLIDGWYGQYTKDAVAKYQKKMISKKKLKKKDIKNYGVMTEKTLKLLKES